MKNAIVTRSLRENISVQQLANRIAKLDLIPALQCVTTLSSRFFWTSELKKNQDIINPQNLSLLAKAIVLWANTKKDIDHNVIHRIDGSETEDLLLHMNSLEWYSKCALDEDKDATLISFLIRQAYISNITNDPLHNNIARTYFMFKKRLPTVTPDLLMESGRFSAAIDVTLDEFWVLTAAIFTFYFDLAKEHNYSWLFTADLVKDSPRKDEINATVAKVLRVIARSPDELRQIYQVDDSKYKCSDDLVGFWQSEFSILRDYPVIRVADDRYCAPFPSYSFLRGSIGFYYDLIDEYAKKEEVEHPDNPNPFDNVVSGTLGAVFQDYVGEHLKQLHGADKALHPEFKYGSKGQKADTPDWILQRLDQLPVFIECKARRPALDLQRYGGLDALRTEIRSVVARALKQFTKFILKADANTKGIEQYANLPKMIYVLVLYDLLPFHALPQIRDIIDQETKSECPDWPRISERVLFLPISVRELEMGIGLELSKGITFETQLEEYAKYRSSATIKYHGPAQVEFPLHYEEYIQIQYNDGAFISNPLCNNLWDEFMRFAFELIYDESLADFERERREEHIRMKAFDFWQDRGCPQGSALDDWLKAEAEIDRDKIR